MPRSPLHRCVVNLDQIVGCKDERDRTVDEAASEEILIQRRRQDLVASRGHSLSDSWTGEPLNIFSRGLFPRVMAVASRCLTVLPFVDISRDREAALPRSSQYTAALPMASGSDSRLLSAYDA